MVKLLLDTGADPNECDRSGRTALHQAVRFGSVAITTLLVDRGADIEATDEHGTTALLLASSRVGDGIGNAESVLFLLNKGANVNAADCSGQTALSFLAATPYKVHKTCVERLIELGASVEVVDEFGLTPLSYFESKQGKEAAQKLILDRKAKAEAARKDNPATPVASWIGTALGKVVEFYSLGAISQQTRQ